MRGTHADLPALKDLSARNAATSPDVEAFADADQSVTWAEFEARSCRAANAFSEFVSTGDRIGFYCKPSVDHAVLFNGALKAGAVTTNLHDRISDEAFRHCLASAKPRVIVVDSELSGTFADAVADSELDHVAAVFTIGEATRAYERPIAAVLADGPATEPDVLASEDDVVTIAWTSGSTGRPTGWCHTNRTMFLKGLELATRSGFTGRDTRLVVNRPSFLVWMSFLTRALLGRERTYYMRDWDPERWLETVERESITGAMLVPTMWREVLDSDPEAYDLSSLTAVTVTGEKLDSETLSAIRERICSNVRQSFGSTEIHSTVLHDAELTPDRVESVGKPQSGTAVRIVDPDGTVGDELPPGERGEIVVKSYDAPVWAWGNDGAIDEAFEDGWWRSGDLGYVDEDGYLYIEGRVDFQIKSKGVKITPEPIERALEAHPAVTSAVVVGVDDPEYGQKVTAIVEDPDGTVSESDLRAWARENDRIADHERPRAYHFVDAIERTPSGKLDRRATMAALGLD